MRGLHLYLGILLSCVYAAYAAFGVTTSGSRMAVDSGAGLVTTSRPISILSPPPHTNGRRSLSQHERRRYRLSKVQRLGAPGSDQVHAAQLRARLGDCYLLRCEQHRCGNYQDLDNRALSSGLSVFLLFTCGHMGRRIIISSRMA